MEFVLLMAVICAGLGFFINGAMGGLLGALFGPFGLIIAAILKDKR